MSVETAPIKYDVTKAQIADLAARYQHIPDMTNRAGYELVRKGIAHIREYRTGIEKRRKELKADALEYGRKVDSAAKEITAELLKIEEPLKTAKAEEDDRKAAIKAEKERVERERVEGIQAEIQEIMQQANIAARKGSGWIRGMINRISEIDITDAYQEFAEQAEQAKAATLAQLRDLHDAAIQREEADRLRKIEDERLAKERAELAVAKKRLAEEDRQRQLDADVAMRQSQRIEAEKQAVERAKIEAERAAVKADWEEMRRQRAEIDARDRAEKARQAAIEAERQRAEVEARSATMRAQRKSEAVRAMMDFTVLSRGEHMSTLYDAIEAGQIPHVGLLEQRTRGDEARARLQEDLARISAEMGLPPAIGPAPGELRRILREGDNARAAVVRAREFGEIVRDCPSSALHLMPLAAKAFLAHEPEGGE